MKRSEFLVSLPGLACSPFAARLLINEHPQDSEQTDTINEFTFNTGVRYPLYYTLKVDPSGSFDQTVCYYWNMGPPAL